MSKKLTRDELMFMLQTHKCEVAFLKVDGTARVMPCTLRADLLPKKVVKEEAEKKERKTNPDNVSVFCLDKNEWRSFKFANIVEVNVIE